jgi:hypothetical protein
VALRMTAAATFAAASVLVIAPGSAQAFPSGCGTGYWPTNTTRPFSGWAYCPSGTGQFRAIVSCDRPGFDYTRYGPWRNIGQPPSYAECDGNHRAYNVRMALLGPV